ncbi:MAG: phage tail protein [Ilumatobacteraceae bacterium]
MPVVATATEFDTVYVGSWFTLELPKITVEGITSVGGLSIEMNVVEVVQALKNGTTQTKKVPGVVKYSEVTVKRPLSADKSLWQWAKDIRDGKKDFRSDGAIVLYDIANTETGRWTFEKAWISKWSASDLDVGSDDPIMEEATLQISTMKRDK